MDFKEAFFTLVSRIFLTESAKDLQRLITEGIFVDILEKVNDQEEVVNFAAERLIGYINADAFLSNPYRDYTNRELAQIKLIDFLKEKALKSIQPAEKPEEPAKKEATEVSPGGEAGEYAVS